MCEAVERSSCVDGSDSVLLAGNIAPDVSIALIDLTIGSDVRARGIEEDRGDTEAFVGVPRETLLGPVSDECADGGKL